MNREAKEITSVGEWLTWRERDVTASRLPVLFDAHPFMSRQQLAAQLRGERTQLTSSALRAGRILEPAVAAAVQEEHPDWKITKATVYCRLPDHRLGATPDYFAATPEWQNAIIQCKTVSAEKWNEWHGHPPLGYVLQTLTEALCIGAQHGYLAVLIRSPSFPLHIYDVPRHPAAEERILDAVAAWWAEHDQGRLPPAVAPEDLAEMVDDGSHLDLSTDNHLPALLDEREALKATTRDSEKRLGDIDATIKAHLGAARTAWLPGWNLTYATQHRRETLLPARDIRVLRVKRTTEDEEHG